MRAIVIVCASLFLCQCAPTSYTADSTPSNERSAHEGASHGYHSHAPVTEYEAPLLEIFQPEPGSQYPIIKLDTGWIELYSIVDRAGLGVEHVDLRLSWSYTFGGPYQAAQVVTVRELPSRDLYAVEWRYTKDVFELPAGCTQIHFIVSAPDSTGQWHISYPWYCFLVVIDMPMCLEVPPQYVSGDTLRSPLVPFAAKLLQTAYDLREVRSIDLWVKRHTDPDQHWFWSQIEQGVVSDTLFGDDTLITQWRWFINTLTYDEVAYDFRLVLTYVDGTVTLDCDGDGRFDDETFWLTGEEYVFLGEFKTRRGCSTPQTFFIRH